MGGIRDNLISSNILIIWIGHPRENINLCFFVSFTATKIFLYTLQDWNYPSFNIYILVDYTSSNFFSDRKYRANFRDQVEVEILSSGWTVLDVIKGIKFSKESLNLDFPLFFQIFLFWLYGKGSTDFKCSIFDHYSFCKHSPSLSLMG